MDAERLISEAADSEVGGNIMSELPSWPVAKSSVGGATPGHAAGPKGHE